MLHKHLTTCRATTLDSYYMKTERSFDNRRNLTDRCLIGSILKCIRKAPYRNPSHMAAIVLCGTVDRILFCDSSKIGTVDNGRAQRVEHMFLGSRINAGTFAGHHHMAHVDIFKQMRVDTGDNTVFHRLVSQVRLGKLLAISVKFVFKRFGVVDTLVFCVGNLLFVSHKHLKIFVDRLRGKLLTVVFVIQVFKLAQGNTLSVDGHKLGIFRAFGLNHRYRGHCQRKRQKSFLHE